MNTPVTLPITDRLQRQAPPPGVYRNVPAKDYHAWNAVSAGLLHTISAGTMMEAQDWLRNREDQDTPSTRFGTFYHWVVLEQDRDPARYQLLDACDRRTKSGKEMYQGALDAVGGDESRLFTVAQYGEALAMSISLSNQPASAVLRNKTDQGEMCAVWVDDATGILCKARADLIRVIGDTTYIIDLKTTASGVDVREFGNTAAKWGYDISAAHYCAGFEKALGKPCRFLFLAQSTERPYMAQAFDATDARVSPNAVDVGKAKRSSAMARLAESIKTNSWPGYSADIQPLILPGWAVPKEVIA